MMETIDLDKVGISPEREESYSLLLKRYLNYVSNLSNEDLIKIVEADVFTYKELIYKTTEAT